ncbi:extracellular solute-binding protein family 5 [Ignisphaera aggregans DSM 17230]|uniref:Extracellular solute-binding protein family 5 n=1 Tax=Ignisphaera aggregans (strain DSM 17230 / JCM 13409 / AQ1.S1) TaxID=583356 RepID=E0SS34_IGNAA|nr:extracellular solute-binding protein family 5 [Ignisphaera aggregans DSM 17230]
MNSRYVFGLVIVLLPIIVSLMPIVNILSQQQLPREETVIFSTQWGTPSGFNPLIPNYAAGSNFLMYPLLFVYGPYTDDYVPYLADSFKWIDPYTLEITIKKDAYWWDGQPITADDVKFSFDIHKMCSTSSSYIWIYISGVDVVDPYTVRIHVNKSNVNYYRVIDVLTWLILPKHRWENLYNQMGCKIATDFKDDDPSQIVGGGPYRLLYYTANSWAYVRVDDWWGKKYFGLPAPKYVVHITPTSDEQVRLEWMQNNRDQMSHYVDRVWEILQADPTKGVFDNQACIANHTNCWWGGSVVFLAFNLEKYPFNDIRVRKALYYALLANNMEAIRKASETAYSGALMPPKLYPVPIIPGLERTERYLARDLVDSFLKEATIENAKKLLDEAGIVDRNGDGIRELPDGKPFRFSLMVVTGWVPTIGSATVFADWWRETLGIEVDVVNYDFSVVWNKVASGDYEAVWWLHSTRMGPSSPWVNFDVAMDIRLGTNPWSGPISRYNNSEVFDILDEIGRTWDDAKRVELYRKLQEIWLRDLPLLILGQDPHWYEYSEAYWYGWPNKERIEKYGAFYATSWDPGFLFVLFQLKPAREARPGEPPTIPDFLKPQNRVPASKFFELLAQTATATPTPSPSPSPSPTPIPGATTVVVTTTVVSTSTMATTVTVPTTVTTSTTVTQTVTEWTTTIILAIVLLIIGFAIGYFVIKPKK